ncbi:MAG: TetR/AcrR family transcriptional regulator C-terminal domain-containing protein, partial [Actinomycetota bacterium]
ELVEHGVEEVVLAGHVVVERHGLHAELDELYRRIKLPYDVADDDWETAVRDGLRAFRSVLTQYPAALELFASRPLPSDAAFNVLVWAYTRFTNVGVDRVNAQKAFHVAVAFTMGHVATELGMMSTPEAEMVAYADQMEDQDAADFIRKRLEITSDDLFEASLDTLVAGLRSDYQLP